MAKPSAGARSAEPSPVVRDDERRATAARRTDGAPAPLWGSFPLSELVVLVALVMIVVGFFRGPSGGVMLGVGLALGALAGLELAAREHFAGYRSHSMLLGGAVAIAVVAVILLVLKGPPVVAGVIGILTTAAAAYLFAGAFRRRSGGALFKIR